MRSGGGRRAAATGWGSILGTRRGLALVLASAVAVALLTMSPARATWSIVGVDEDTGEVGVAVASCVGFEVTVVPVLVPGVGAAASQADISEASGDRIVEALQSGATAGETIDAVVAADDAPDDRQFGVVVLGSGAAGWTGSDTFDVAIDEGGAAGAVSAQGNILVSDEVVTSAIEAFEASRGELADRLVDALVAGADAGGDSRCEDQTATSAALIVARPGDVAYSNTDAGVFGVDPEGESVPSVFVSVLVEAGGDRAPDRLATAWAGADRSADQVVIQQVDAGADASAEGARQFVGTFLLVVLTLLVAAVVLFIWRRRRRGTAD